MSPTIKFSLVTGVTLRVWSSRKQRNEDAAIAHYDVGEGKK
jgi:hypothetical protein